MLISLSHKQNEAGRTCTLNQTAHGGGAHFPNHDKVDLWVPFQRTKAVKISNRELARF